MSNKIAEVKAMLDAPKESKCPPKINSLPTEFKNFFIKPSFLLILFSLKNKSNLI